MRYPQDFVGVWVFLTNLLLSPSLNDLAEFIQVTSAGLGVTVEKGEYDSLVAVMKHLLKVRDRQPNTDGMFEPLKQMIELLKTYNQDLPDEVYQQLEVGGGVMSTVPSVRTLWSPEYSYKRPNDFYDPSLHVMRTNGLSV